LIKVLVPEQRKMLGVDDGSGIKCGSGLRRYLIQAGGQVTLDRQKTVGTPLANPS